MAEEMCCFRTDSTGFSYVQGFFSEISDLYPHLLYMEGLPWGTIKFLTKVCFLSNKRVEEFKMNFVILISCTVKGPAKRIQHHPTLLNLTLLDNVAHCWMRWQNECNMLDPTLRLERSGSKVYPEFLENNRAPYLFA